VERIDIFRDSVALTAPMMPMLLLLLLLLPLLMLPLL